jgi:hypothetical protein
LDPTQCAGYIAVDDQYRRISIESTQHRALKNLREKNTVFWSADQNTNEDLMFQIVRAYDNIGI